MSVEQFGWVPYEERTHEQQVMSDEHRENTAPFGAVNYGLGDLPKHALLYDLEVAATGKLCNRIWQMTGSCVGAGAGRAYTQTMCGDKVHRKTNEEIKDVFPWATYGIGRRNGGMRGRGDGSFGGAQAKASREFGLLAADDERLPKPTNRNGWLVWSAQIEREYSWPAQWPIKESELAKSANERQVQHVARITTWDELLQAFAQGYGVTCASMFGTRPVVRSGFLVGEWNLSWAHQMSWSGYYEHPDLGVLIACDNQWGPNAHPECPFLSAKGVTGSFWIRKETITRILSQRTAEVYAHGDTEDWPTRTIDWNSMWMG